MFKKILIYLLMSTLAISAEYTMDELNKLKELKFISDEEYEIFKNELLGVEQGESLYTLSVNNIKVSQIYPVLQENNKTYFPVVHLFNTIGFTNYSILSGTLSFKLGTNSEEITVDSNKNQISGIKNQSKINCTSEDIIVTNSDFYIESEIFKKIFLRSFTIDSSDYKLAKALSFETPDEIKMYLKNMEDGLIDAQNAGEIMFTSKRSLFELGNLGVRLEGYTERTESDKNFNTDWTGNLEYQGGLLYGEFTVNYDVRNNEMGDAALYYPDIWKDHSFEVRNSRGSSSNREWEVTFRKEKGYFKVGRNFVNQ